MGDHTDATDSRANTYVDWVDTMAAIEFNYHSARSQQARVGQALTGLPVTACYIIAWLLPLAGVMMLVTGIAIGWLMIGLAALPVMVIKWYKGHLHHLPSGTGDTVDALLSGDILGQLSQNPSPADIAKAISTISSAHFMAARFGITVNILQQLASTDASQTAAVWQTAEQVRQQAGVERYSASVLAVADRKSVV